MPIDEPRSILITGASSGIGAALARAYAAPGRILHLGGRDAARLEAVAADCRKAGAAVWPRVIDVTGMEAMAAWIGEAHALAPLGLVVANAGINTGADAPSFDQVRGLFAVNVDGVFNTVLPAIPLMRAAGGGQIAVMSSVHGLRGQPALPGYSASKAAVKAWGEALRDRLRGEAIRVSVICPGPVHSAMTTGLDADMVDAAEAASIIRAGLAANKACIAFPRRQYAVALLKALVPASLVDRWRHRAPRKRLASS